MSSGLVSSAPKKTLETLHSFSLHPSVSLYPPSTLLFLLDFLDVPGGCQVKGRKKKDKRRIFHLEKRETVRHKRMEDARGK